MPRKMYVDDLAALDILTEVIANKVSDMCQMYIILKIM